MLIIKKYRDYYDSSMGTDGIDKTCVYDRSPDWEKSQSKRRKIDKIFSPNKFGWYNDPFSFDHLKCSYGRKQTHKKNEPVKIYPFIIGFCGKLYVGYELTYEYRNKSDICDITETKVVYDMNEFISLLSPKDQKEQSNRINNFYQKYDKKDYKDVFVEYHVPVFVYDYGTNIPTDLNVKDEHGNIPRFITNPKLSGYEFFKVFNSFTTFQEIQMFLQGVLGMPEKELINISEKDRIQQYGFDKWSFRNPDPPKRKQKNLN
jgi:hypothetical protein